MAGTVRTYWSAVASWGGVFRAFGSLVRRFKEFTFAGLEPTVKQFTLPKYNALDPADPTLLLTYLERPEFALVLVSVETEHGVFELYEVCDAPSSCTFPQPIHLTSRRVHATLAIANGIDGEGRPLLATDAGTVAGRAHRWYAFNRDATKDVNIRLILFPN
jgi:hypothetical protein